MALLSNSLRELLSTQGEIKPQLHSQPLFVTGCMRSGTTLLVNKLSQHPQLLKIGFELNQVWTEIGHAPCGSLECTFMENHNASFDAAFQMTNYFSDSIEASKSLKRTVMRAYNSYKLQEGRIFYDWKQVIPVNKSPHLINKIGFINTLFPESKIILIIRDIYGQSASQKFHFEDYYKSTGIYNTMISKHNECWNLTKTSSEGSYPGNFSSIPKMWLRLNQCAIEAIKRIPESQRIIIRYEDLIENQPEVLSKVFEHLNLNAKHQSQTNKIISRISSFKNTTTKGDPLKKWMTQLKEEEIASIDTVTQQEEYNLIEAFIQENNILSK
ncbi:MAG: sulfotransferase [Flavobacteriales bacterium]|nr:sulfotransferase [Flavobacteriales bacterium]